MSDCRFGVSPVNSPDPDPERRRNTVAAATREEEPNSDVVKRYSRVVKK